MQRSGFFSDCPNDGAIKPFRRAGLAAGGPRSARGGRAAAPSRASALHVAMRAATRRLPTAESRNSTHFPLLLLLLRLCALGSTRLASLVDRLIMMCVWAMAMQLQRLPKCAAAKPDDR